MNRAVFLDRDGTINREKSYLAEPEALELLNGVPEALRSLQDHGFLLFVVTNQSGIGRGFYTERELKAVHDRLVALAAESGVVFRRIYYAPETPDEPTCGRKPSPRFLFNASKIYRIELSRSYMIGDKLSDLQCGWNAGVRKSILVKTGYGSQLLSRPDIDLSRAQIAENLTEAAEYILSDSSSMTDRRRHEKLNA